MPGYRSAVALTELLRRDFIYRFRLSTLLGLGAAAITWLVLGAMTPGGMVPPLTDAALAGGVDLAVSAVAYVLLLDGRTRRPLEAVWWLARLSSARYKAMTGDGRVPATPRAASAWLERHPATETTRGSRVFSQLVVGNVTAAWQEAALLPERTPLERFGRAMARGMIRYVEGQQVDMEPMREAAALLEGEQERLHAAGDVAMLEALSAIADGRDWRPVMLTYRDRLGHRADRVLIPTLWLPVGASMLLLAAMTGVAAVLARWSFSFVGAR